MHFTDDGFSGGSFDRPGWKPMLSRIENCDIGTVMVKDMSRVGRDYLLNYYKDVRAEFEISEWIDVFLGAMGYNAAGYKNEEELSAMTLLP